MVRFSPTFTGDRYVSLRRDDGRELALLDRTHPTLPAAYRFAEAFANSTMLPSSFHHGGTMAALNIKNDETYALARELAEATGESLTEAVTTAVRERLVRLRVTETADQQEERHRRAWATAQDVARRLGPYDPDVDPTAFLYDEETGLPK